MKHSFSFIVGLLLIGCTDQTVTKSEPNLPQNKPNIDFFFMHFDGPVSFEVNDERIFEGVMHDREPSIGVSEVLDIEIAPELSINLICKHGSSQITVKPDFEIQENIEDWVYIVSHGGDGHTIAPYQKPLILN